MPIRGFIDDFNDRRATLVRPGEFLVVDECMSFWEGLDNIHNDFGLPHSSKQLRKPRSQGCELKSCADAQTGIMMRLEILEGRARQGEKPFAQELPPSTALVLRLTLPWFTSKRTVVADSAFASVQTAHEVLKRGMHFIGVVKTGHKRFPRRYMLRWSNDGTLRRGAHKLLTSTVRVDGVNKRLTAVCWKDKLPKMLIGTRGATIPGTPIKRVRFTVRRYRQSRKLVKQKHDLTIHRPKMVEQYFTNFSAIDIHDHLRQGSLCIEESWKTKIWWHRIFASVLAMIFVDSYRMYQFSYKSCHEQDLTGSFPFRKFLHRLVYELCKNESAPVKTRAEAVVEPVQPPIMEEVRIMSIFCSVFNIFYF